MPFVSFLLALLLGAAASPAAPLSPAEETIRGARLVCRAGQTCSPSVALFASSESDQRRYGLCTATLVGANLVATAAHCLPDDLQRAGAACRGRAVLHFAADPAHPDYERSAECEQVISARHGTGVIYGDQADLAFVRISPVRARPPVEVSRAGLADEQTYFVDKMDVSERDGRFEGRLGRVRCRALQHTALAAGFTGPLAEAGLLTDCEEPVHEGNSGSAVRDEAGLLHAVIYSIYDEPAMRSIERKLKENGTAHPPLASFAFAANLACAELPAALGSSRPAACAEAAPPHRGFARLEEQTKAATLPYAEQNQERHPAFSWFRWKRFLLRDRLSFVPTCVRVGKAMVGRAAAVGTINFRLASRADRYTRYLETTVQPLPPAPTMVELHAAGRGRYRLSTSDATLELSPCTDR